MDSNNLNAVERLISDSFKEITDHMFQDEVQSVHIKNVKNNLSQILELCRKENQGNPEGRIPLDDSTKSSVLKFAYVMSRFDYYIINDILDEKFNQGEAFKYLEKITKVKATSLRNHRDRFDPYVKQERSNRVGWHQHELSDEHLAVKSRYDEMDYDSIKTDIEGLLDKIK